MKLGDLPVLSIHAFRDIVGCDLLDACDLDVLRWDFAEEGKLAMIESSKARRSRLRGQHSNRTRKISKKTQDHGVIMWILVEDLDVGVVMMCGLWVRQRLVVLLVSWAELSLREVRVWIPSRSIQEKKLQRRARKNGAGGWDNSKT